MTISIMLDLETWGKRPGCDIRSIGAVVFDPTQPDGCRFNKPEMQFYIATDNPTVYRHTLQSPPQGPAAKYPLHRDPETVAWWNDQSPEAQDAFANPINLREACLQFTSWLKSLCYAYRGTGKTPDYDIRIWANGPQFDVSILEAVYHAVGLPVPWHYRAPRDMRTITDAAGMTRDEFSNYGDAHNALHDAIAQAMTVCEAYKRLGLRK